MHWPTVIHQEVFHVGTLDPAKKGTTHNRCSHEGNGLSVSLEPQAWTHIAKLGGYPTWALHCQDDDASGRGLGLFLNAYGITPKQHALIAQWAQAQDLIKQTSIAVVSWYDSEEDTRRNFQYDTSIPEEKASAQSEYESLREDGDESAALDFKLSWVAQPKLNQRIGFRVPHNNVQNMLLTLYVQDVLFPQQGLHGVWWEDDLDIHAGLAPCGVIHADAMALWQHEDVATKAGVARLDTVTGFVRALAPFKDEAYSAIVQAHDCGPFDGGCVLFAQALQNVIGGDVAVIINAQGRADHAAVFLNGKLYDFDGPLAPNLFMRRFEINEHVKIGGWRTLEAGDLEEAIRDPQTQKILENILTAALGDNFKKHNSLHLAKTAISFINTSDKTPAPTP